MSFVRLAEIADTGDSTSTPSQRPTLYVAQHRPGGGDARQAVA